MNADSLTFAILAWPLASGLLLALHHTGRALYRHTRTHTRSTR